MDILKDRYSITELSECLNITDHALRFYEKEFGLKIPKDSRGRRFYTTELANVMYQIKDMRDQGLELKAIRKILEDEHIIKVNPPGTALNSSVQLNEAQLPAIMGHAASQLSSTELTAIIDALNNMKEQVFNNISTELLSTREQISKEIHKSKLELGACVENSSRKLEIKLDRHFQEVDRNITSWRERKSTSLGGRLKKLIGKA
ncbi:MerR family transcriptional regulator [Ruminiclostridium cellobioparum]|jgi:DNA-binding transcriptional MerR regulator|uniref:MerR family transcriptional regulator n=1 Tax=Ruminiclostridium cellobioparum TaxID=29355 RepID=UPI00048534BB|nr:MerR family transcriptional regulator [Ruminiclostridium cellobioparum]